MVVIFFLLFVRFFSALIIFSILRTYLKISGILALALGLSFFCLSLIDFSQVSSAGLSNPELVFLTLREIWIGILQALPLALALESFALTGRMVDVSRGAQLAEQLFPGSLVRMSVCENAFLLAGFVLVFASGGYQFLILNLIDSLTILELGNLKQAAVFDILQIIKTSSRAIEYGICLALPVVILCWLVDILGAVASRMFEKLNLMMEITLIKLILGLGVLVIASRGYL
ncbi:MAG: flagellar biosynthetic protein FliR [Deltaproteobacteria bacterium]|jgi:flagellar biosynthesis protein FliR|nr:flagellar biosynthetic protein FliR [Deltaproteobacteria bacterium]